jgi:hypothetical protein
MFGEEKLQNEKLKEDVRGFLHLPQDKMSFLPSLEGRHDPSPQWGSLKVRDGWTEKEG